MAQLTKQQKRQARAEDFKNQKIQKAKDFNFAQHDPKKHSGDGAPHISQQEVKFLRQNNKNNQGKSARRDTYNELLRQKEAGATFSKRAESQMNRMGKRIEKGDAKRAARQEARERAQAAMPEQPVQPEQNAPKPPDNSGVPGSSGPAYPDIQPIELPTYEANQQVELDNSQEQNVNMDNDITNDVSGNDNYIVNNQDNSIRQYGGDNRSLVINSAGGSSVGDALDGVGTAGTLSGIWDANDSPAAQAARFDLHSTLQRDAQKQFNDTSYIAQGAVKRAEQNSYINPAALDARIRAREQANRDRSTVLDASLFGSRDHILEWEPVKPGKPVKEPDIQGLAETYTDF